MSSAAFVHFISIKCSSRNFTFCVVMYTGYYGKYPKISYTTVSDKLAYENGAEPDQTSLSTLFAIPLSILRNNCMKKQNLGQKVWNKVFKILGHLLYIEVKNLLQCFGFIIDFCIYKNVLFSSI